MTAILQPVEAHALNASALDRAQPGHRARWRFVFDKFPGVRHRQRITVDERDYFVQSIGKTPDHRRYQIEAIEA